MAFDEEACRCGPQVPRALGKRRSIYWVCARKLLRRRADVDLRRPRLGEAQLNIRVCAQWLFRRRADVHLRGLGPWGSASQYRVCARKLLRRRADIHLRCPGPWGNALQYSDLRPMAFDEEACRCPPQVARARICAQWLFLRRGPMLGEAHLSLPARVLLNPI